MAKVSIDEAQHDLAALIARIEAGKLIILTRDGKPVAKLEPCKPRFGSMKGRIKLDDSFFDPLPEEELRAWEGG